MRTPTLLSLSTFAACTAACVSTTGFSSDPEVVCADLETHFVECGYAPPASCESDLDGAEVLLDTECDDLGAIATHADNELSSFFGELPTANLNNPYWPLNICNSPRPDSALDRIERWRYRNQKLFELVSLYRTTGTSVMPSRSPRAWQTIWREQVLGVNHANVDLPHDSQSLQEVMEAASAREPRSLENLAPGDMVLHYTIELGGSDAEEIFEHARMRRWYDIVIELVDRLLHSTDSARLELLGYVGPRAVRAVERGQVFKATFVGPYRYNSDLDRVTEPFLAGGFRNIEARANAPLLDNYSNFVETGEIYIAVPGCN